MEHKGGQIVAAAAAAVGKKARCVKVMSNSEEIKPVALIHC